MCGIFGLFSENIHNIKIELENSLHLLKHRGPDNIDSYESGDLYLGHTRLSIFDISNSAHQPMEDYDSGSTIVFNGAIYNYKELKEKYLPNQKFRSNSDTEVLLKLLVNYGYEIIKELNGMWSFAFYDNLNKKLLISRDRFGQKPLYFLNEKNIFCFSSEVRPIFNIFPRKKELDELMLKNFLSKNYLNLGNKTFYKNIKILEPGTNLVFDMNNKTYKVYKFWNYSSGELKYKNISEYEDEFECLFDSSVKLRLRGDQKCALSLSGGLDSTSILASANKQKTNSEIETFTSASSYTDYSEDNWATIASNYSKNKNNLIFQNNDNWISELKKAIFVMDSPSYSPAIISYMSLVKSIKDRGYKVLLEGQGADEAIGGYQKYASQYIVKKNNIPSIYKFYKLSKNFNNKDLLFWTLRFKFPELFNLYRKKNSINKFLRFNLKNIDTRFDITDIRKALIEDHSNDILPGLLKYGDNISMFHSIEARNPYLDYRLVNFLMTIPDNVRYFNYESKYLIRKYLLKNKYTSIAKRKDKLGYITPIIKWIIRDRGKILSTIKEETHLDELLHKENFCNLIKGYKGDASQTHYIFKILSTQIWLKQNF